MNDFVLLDTDAASYLFKKSPLAKPFRALLKGKRTAMAFASVAELYKWTIKQRWSAEKVSQLEAAMHNHVVIPYDRDLAWAWARVVAACEGAGRPMAPTDAWIAAAALRHDVELATNNTRHYEAAETLCGLRLLRAQ